jgi:Fe-S cluster assembly scaffold protein SufB
MIEYRRKNENEKWHWCLNCKNYPTEFEEYQNTKPSDIDLCDECLRNENENICQKERRFKAGVYKTNKSFNGYIEEKYECDEKKEIFSRFQEYLKKYHDIEIKENGLYFSSEKIAELDSTTINLKDEKIELHFFPSS